MAQTAVRARARHVKRAERRRVALAEDMRAAELVARARCETLAGGDYGWLAKYVDRRILALRKVIMTMRANAESTPGSAELLWQHAEQTRLLLERQYAELAGRHGTTAGLS